MAAYAALLSLTHILDQIQKHPRLTISPDNSNEMKSLCDNVRSLVDFFEAYSYGGNELAEAERETLESRVAEVAYEAEDIIESEVVDHILNNSFFISFPALMSNVIKEMDSIKQWVMEIRSGSQLDRPAAGLSTSPSSTINNDMVGFGEELYKIQEKLFGRHSGLQIIPIVGMPGSGKTMLAQHVYNDQLTIDHFDVSVWVSISQKYNTREVFLRLVHTQRLGCESLDMFTDDEMRDIGKEQLAEQLHKSLWGRRYLIVLDDLWSLEAWDMVRLFFPNNDNRSRVIITTRLSSVAGYFDSSGIKMNFLDEGCSWSLFCRQVFAQGCCPLEFEGIGKKVVKRCRGLPLSIVVIGELLAGAKRTRADWQHVGENINSIINLRDDKRCTKLLSLSYDHLPIHLKPCFLYMGAFPEGSEIRVSRLIKLWIAEGFLKLGGEDLEVVGEEYLMDLISRNLVLVDKWRSTGKLKSCKMHHLLRDFCLREALREKFLYVPSLQTGSNSDGIERQRRLSVQQNTLYEEYRPLANVLQPASLARSLICDIDGILPLETFRLLRVLKVADRNRHQHQKGKQRYSLDDTFQLLNLRYISRSSSMGFGFKISFFSKHNMEFADVNCGR